MKHEALGLKEILFSRSISFQNKTVSLETWVVGIRWPELCHYSRAPDVVRRLPAPHKSGKSQGDVHHDRKQ